MNPSVPGHTITLADISVCCALVDGMQKVFDEGIRKEQLVLGFGSHWMSFGSRSFVGNAASSVCGAFEPLQVQQPDAMVQPLHCDAGVQVRAGRREALR